ncbi:OLC1v1031001C1 [Oldenlandia corymbosa var. corymbosa]|uniref:OLC1v1031001C1 n=1 Tax=Oldenlandia corymbosa var. corymbosa TaxID=529605 RepID=A0AAV1CI78_OLDCO|nr:OLC1v1031001C1 [Oldenlandia corymbosa var. corymbosa]
METFAYTRPRPLIIPSQTSFLSSNSPSQLGILTLKNGRNNQSPPILQLTSISATLNTPKGFGPPPKKSKRTKKSNNDDEDDEDDEDEGEDRGEAGVIPEIVTNRMMSRMAFSVGIPLFTGLLFFPLFYYLKAGLKIDVPTWIPFIVSFIFFGTALLGVSYGIVSSSWDPLREGSFWGWTEAQKNWPVFWQSIWGGSGSKKK